MFPENDPLVGKRIGNYVVVELLAKGGMGSVYLGQHPEIGRQVAIKVLFSSLTGELGFNERFVAEAKVLARLDHPNIIQLFDFGRTEDGQLYYVMERLRGGDLAEYLNESGQLSAYQAWPILQQICSALQTAHDHGIIHRDLKLENIFIRRRDPIVVQLLDFGIAKVLEHGSSKQWHTSTGMVIGTPVFMAPEQAAGRADQISTKTDVYALGVMLHLLLTGEPPFWADTAPELLVKHLHEPPPPLITGDPMQPPALTELAQRCLAKKPHERPRSARAVALAFADAIGEEVTDSILKREELIIDAEQPSGTDETVPATPSMYRRKQNQRRAGRTGPPTKVNTISTLSSSVGELWSSDVFRPRRARRWIIVGAIVGALTAGGLLLQRHVSSDGEAIKTAATAKPAKVSATPLAPDDAAAGVRSGQRIRPRHLVQVKLSSTVDAAAAAALTCDYQIDGAARQSMALPCRIPVKQGAQIELTITGRPGEPRKWKVDEGTQILVRQTKTGWAFTDDSVPDDGIGEEIDTPTKPTQVVLKKRHAKRVHRTRKRSHRRGRSRARVSKKEDKPKLTPAVEPKKPPTKKVPKRVGAGTMDF